MARKTKRPKTTTRASAWRIQKLDNVPGPEADESALKAHYRLVQNVLAKHAYDDVIAACHWCCDMDEQLAYSKPGTRGGPNMYCSGRCASAYAKYQQLNYRKPGEAGTSATSATSAAPPAEKLVGDDEEAETPNVPTAAFPEATERETEPTPEQRRHAAKKNPQRKARKAREKKPERTDGLCAKGEHKMTDANRYSYRNTVWCRACRAESRARSAAKRN